jgi:hypothetical protein
VIIDGYTQPGAIANTNAIDDPDPNNRGFNGSVLVELSGSNSILEGLSISAGNSIVRGLVINRFVHNGINIGGTGNVIEGNLVGVDATGTIGMGNRGSGIAVSSSSNRIGGMAPSSRNIISDNFYWGIFLSGSAATGNVIQGNFVGTDATGTIRLGNGQSGIHLEGASNNTIGGTQGGARNVVSANGSFVNANGIDLFYSSNLNTVQGNFVGVDVSGTHGLGNTQVGIGIYGSRSNLIGGLVPDARNIISDSKTSSGISLSSSSQNTIQGNFIGTDASGTSGLGNFLDGVDLFATVSGTLVGGITSGAGNLIAFNQGNGVHVRGGGSISRTNAILGNSTFANGGLAIELDSAGMTGNDGDDADSGPNNLQNFPEISSAVLNETTLTLAYIVPSTATNSAYPLRVEALLRREVGRSHRLIGPRHCGGPHQPNARGGTKMPHEDVSHRRPIEDAPRGWYRTVSRRLHRADRRPWNLYNGPCDHQRLHT